MTRAEPSRVVPVISIPYPGVGRVPENTAATIRVSKSTTGTMAFRPGVRRPDGGKRLPIADDEAAQLDQPAVFAAREGLDVGHHRTVNSTSRDAVALPESVDFASTRST